MRSQRHKVLHQIAGKPMLWHVLVALDQAGVSRRDTVIVLGDGAQTVREAVEALFGADAYRFVLQEPQLGTGHAAAVAREAVGEGAETVVVAFGDTPLLQPGTVQRLLRRHREGTAPLTLTTGHLRDPSGYGRIVRSGDEVRQIVEDRDASDEQRRLTEVNSGFCAFSAPWLWSRLPRVQPAPNGELYLTALPAIAVAEGAGVGTLVLDEVMEAVGVNTRLQLAEAEQALRPPDGEPPPGEWGHRAGPRHHLRRRRGGGGGGQRHPGQHPSQRQHGGGPGVRPGPQRHRPGQRPGRALPRPGLPCGRRYPRRGGRRWTVRPHPPRHPLRPRQ